MNDLQEIDYYRKLTEKEFIFLSLYYFYRFKFDEVNIFSEKIVFHEKIIINYNRFISLENNKIIFYNYIIGQRDYINECLRKLKEKPWEYFKPVIWSDREKNHYYIKKLTKSHRFEIYIDMMFKKKDFDIGLYYGREEQYSGESKAGIEIKNDIISQRSGNLYIEYKERNKISGKWVDSGILKKDNTVYFAIGNFEFIYFIKKSVLIDVRNNKYPNITITNVCPSIGTSKGYLLSIEDAEKLCEPIEEVIQNLQSLQKLT
jgi:hypothetical protein